MSEVMSEVMSEADKMFYKTNYKEKRMNIKEGKIEYEEYNYNEQTSYIYFRHSNKSIIINGRLTMQELKAINKKCEELGWI